MKNRIISLFLTLTMIFLLIPAGIFAEDEMNMVAEGEWKEEIESNESETKVSVGTLTTEEPEASETEGEEQTITTEEPEVGETEGEEQTITTEEPEAGETEGEEQTITTEEPEVGETEGEEQTITTEEPEAGETEGEEQIITTEEPETGETEGEEQTITTEEPEAGEIDGEEQTITTEDPEAGEIDGEEQAIITEEPEAGETDGEEQAITTEEPEAGETDGEEQAITTEESEAGESDGEEQAITTEEPEAGETEEEEQDITKQEPEAGETEEEKQIVTTEEPEADETEEERLTFEIKDDALIKYNGEDIEVTIPDGIRIVEIRAFSGNNKIEKVILPDSVEIIKNYAFEECPNLEEVIIGEQSKLRTIGKGAFKNDTKLDVSFAENVKNIVDTAFEGVLSAEKPVSKEDVDEEKDEIPVVLKLESETQELEKIVIDDNLTEVIVETAFDGENDSISITKQPSDVTALLGTNAVFRVEAEGEGLTYSWQVKTSETAKWLDTSTGSGYKTYEFTIPATKGRNGFQYRCMVKSSDGTEKASEAAQLSVTGVIIRSHPSDVTADIGTNAVFSVEAEGNGLTYSWQVKTSETAKWLDTSTGSGYKTATFTLPVTKGRNGFQYRCLVKSSDGTEVLSEAVRLTVTSIKITKHPVSITADIGSSATFSVEAEGEDLTYSWQVKTSEAAEWLDTSLGSGYKTATFKIGATKGRNGFKYRCVVKSSDGTEKVSEAAQLTVTSIKIKTQPTDAVERIGENAIFEVVAEGEGLTYSWQVKTSETANWLDTSTGSGYKTETFILPVTKGRNGFKYRCVINSSDGTSKTTKAVVLRVSSINIKTQPQDATALLGKNAIYKVTAEGQDLTYSWQVKTSETAKWLDTSTGSGYKTATFTIPATKGRNGFQYRCMVKSSDGTEKASEAATLTVTSVLITKQPVSVTADMGSSTTFSVTAEGEELSYSWQVKTSETAAWLDTSTGSGFKTATFKISATKGRNGFKYRCVVKSSDGTEKVSEAAQLTVTSIKIKTQPTDAVERIGENAIFEVVAEGEGLTYSWQVKTSETANWLNTSTGSGYKTEVFTLPVTKGRNGFQYRCVINSSDGTSKTTKAVTLRVTSINIKTQPQDVTAVLKKNAVFKVTAEGTGLTYSWQVKTGETAKWLDTSTGSGYKTATFTIPATAGRNGFQYRCMVKSSDGTEKPSESATLTVTSVMITKHPIDLTVDLGSNAVFKVTTEGEGQTYSWQVKTSETANWRDTTTGSGYKTATFTVPAIIARQGFQYRCVVTGSDGEVKTSSAATLTIQTMLIKRGVVYELIDGSMCVTGYTEEVGSNVYVESKVGGYPVTIVSANAFIDNRDITSIDLPNSITTIGACAFKNCENLSTMNTH